MHVLRKGLDKEMGMSGMDAKHPSGESFFIGYADLSVLMICDLGILIVYSIKLSLSV